MNDRGGVIGIATATVVGGQNLNFAIPSIRVGTLSLKRGTPVPFGTGSIGPSSDSLAGFRGFPWGTAMDAVVAALGPAVGVQQLPEYQTALSYATVAFGRKAVVLYGFDHGRLTLGHYVIPVGDHDCADVYRTVRTAISAQHPQAAVTEKGPPPYEGLLCRRLAEGTPFAWAATWDLTEGEILMGFVPRPEALMLEVLYIPPK
jgi:hypothetical protein